MALNALTHVGMHVTTLGKLFTHMYVCSPNSIIWYPVLAKGR